VGCPEFTGFVEQPGMGLKFGLCPPALLLTRLFPVKAISEFTFAVNGTPVCAEKMLPSSHPDKIARGAPWRDSETGIFQVPFSVKLWVILKSETPF